MDAGWTRWVLEQYGFDFVTRASRRFPFTAVWPGRRRRSSRRGQCADRGRPRREGRCGTAARRPEYADTLTPQDLPRSSEFVRGGGTVVCLSNAATLRDSAVQAAGEERGRRPSAEEFFLRRLDRRSRRSIPHIRSWPACRRRPRSSPTAVPCSRRLDGFKGTVLARYAETGSPLLSGYLVGEKYLQGKAAALDVRARRGARRPARLPPAVARTVVRHVPRLVQRGDQSIARIAVIATGDSRLAAGDSPCEPRTVCRRRRAGYSYRSACIGCTRDARYAGM